MTYATRAWDRLNRLRRQTGAPQPLSIGVRPSPLEAHSGLGAEVGCDLYLKREDRIDDLGCGHKLRKLSYLVAAALQQKASVLVTAGSLPSNQCKSVAALASQLGLRSHVIFGGDSQARPVRAHGNYLLTSLMGPQITWRERAPWASIDGEIEQVARDERTKGEIPFVVRPGASDWPGLLGSVELGVELAIQLDAIGHREVTVVAAAGSGGTCAGLKAAADLLGLRWNVVGMCIGEGAEVVAANARHLRSDLNDRLQGSLPDCAELSFDEAGIGQGYDRSTDLELDMVKQLARQFGLLFDANYMVKTYLGLLARGRRGELGSGAPVVLIHSGGHMGIFDGGEAWSSWHAAKHPAWTADGSPGPQHPVPPHTARATMR